MYSISTRTLGINDASIWRKTSIYAAWTLAAPMALATSSSLGIDPSAIQAGSLVTVQADLKSQAKDELNSELLTELRRELPGARQVGTAKLKFWGFDVYTATLWAAPGFKPTQYAQHSFALDLAYLTSLEGSAIAKRSLAEMQRLGTITPERAQAWQGAMAELFPDVKAGDRITGLHRAGSGAAFWVNGKAKGEIKDVEFARLFFGIWLAEGTSEPAMRQALLGLRPT